MMPGMDGIETCEIIRSIKIMITSLLLLTARSEDYSQVAGLEAGEDDYINKPIKPKVLVSKLKKATQKKNISRHKSKYFQ